MMMMMFFSNLWRVFRKRTFINVLFWIFHFRFEKNDSLHFTSIPFPWRPPCLLLRGYAAAVVWNGMYCEHIWCGGVGRVGVGDRIVVVLSWYCRGIVCIYIWKMGKNGEKKTYLGLPGLGRWCGVVSCRVLGLAALLAVVVSVSVVCFIVFGVPAVAVTVAVVVTIFAVVLREEGAGVCFCYCCDWRCRLLHKPGTLAA